MPRSHDLVGTYVGREESPEAEMLMQEAIGSALILLLTEKGLYQRCDINTAPLEKHLSLIDSKEKLAIKAEFSKRPWVPVSQNQSSENRRRAEFFCGVSDSPLSAPSDELKLAFPLPAIKHYCSTCKDDHTYSSITTMWWDGFTNVYPRYGERTGQIFLLTYLCGVCQSNPLTFLVKREGYKLVLCGRSERLKVSVSKQIPRDLRSIIEDAIGAANENDVSAGFYHLRTFCEHYMKKCLSVDVSERITGEELGEKYKASLDKRMAAGLPSMTFIYERTSKYMHERSGSYDDFLKILSEIEGHLSAKELFQKFGV